MLVMSGLLDKLEEYSYVRNGDAHCIYGDPAYHHICNVHIW